MMLIIFYYDYALGFMFTHVNVFQNNAYDSQGQGLLSLLSLQIHTGGMIYGL
jgi:hypothetical protein